MVSGRREREVGDVLNRLLEWAALRPDVRGLALVGSWARGEAGESSDVDLLVLTVDERRYTRFSDWVDELGAGDIVRTRRWGAVTECRFAAADGLDVDLAIASPGWASLTPVDEGTRRVAGDGMRVLYDPDELLARLQREVG